MRRIASGEVTQRVYFRGPPGLTGHTVGRARNADTFTAMTTPTVTELGSTGVYSVLLDEDMTITANKLSEPMSFLVEAAGMTPELIEIELFRPDNYNINKIAGHTLTDAGTGGQLIGAV